ESVTNVLKHAKATKLYINLTKENNFLILTIEDNGLGFDVESLNKSGKGIGLLAVKNRAVAIGASMDISSEIGKGTLISIEVPISEKDEA
nr:ATP-binding protein [Sediminibacterium sp.]